MSEEYDDYEADEGGGIPSIFIYIGGLIAVNVVLVVVDAPFFIY